MRSRSNAAPIAAFTLFEIAIALGLVTVAMLSTLLAFPAGLKAQQFARMRIIAATKAEELVEAFNSTHNATPASDTEAFEPWDVPVSYRSQTFDLEQRLASHRFGVLPVPVEIARRVDSTGGEIEQILDNGGGQPNSPPHARPRAKQKRTPPPPPPPGRRGGGGGGGAGP